MPLLRAVRRLILLILILILGLARTAIGFAPAQAQDRSPQPDLSGVWAAEEDYFNARLRFEYTGEGVWNAFIVGQEASGGSPFHEVTVRSDSVLLRLDEGGQTYFRGVFSDDGPTIAGEWTQGAQSAPVTFAPDEEAMSSSPPSAASSPPRPQEPEPPYPYAAEEVTFESEAGGVTLSGTLTRPEGDGPHPAVVLLSGTGASNRDYEISGHKSFLVLADHLTRNGIAVLRYDRRGVGASDGSLEGARLEDFARDAAAALRFVKAQPGVDASEVGLVGHSMGGFTAPRVSNQFEAADFLVLLMPLSLPGYEVMVEQEPRMWAASGASQAKVDSARVAARRLNDILRADTDSATAAAQLREMLEEESGMGNQELEAQVKAGTSPWWREMLRYDPRPALRDVEAPVLAVFGTKDIAVPPEQNAEPMRMALADSPSGDATVHVLDGLNHWMQPAKTGSPAETGQIETTIAPNLLNLVTEWIQTRTAGEPE